MAKADLTAERLRKILHYDPETGIFRWTGALKKTIAGVTAGSNASKGYKKVGVCGVVY